MKKSEVRIIKRLSKELRNELLSNIIPYWLTYGVDHESGGFFGQIDFNNKIIKDADKGSVLMSRILWTFSACQNEFGNDDFKDAANHAYDFVSNHCWDSQHGGVYWMVQSDGAVRDQRKLAYAQAFAIYSLSEYFGASKNQEALNLAIALFEIMEEKCADKKNGGYHEVFDSSWNKLDDPRLSDQDQNSARSTNTHLHILEAYTNLYKYWNSQELRQSLRRMVELFINRIINHDQTSAIPFFDEKWVPETSDISYGHDIETSWLLHEAAKLLNDPDLLDTVETISINIATFVKNNGVDNDGGIFNKGNLNGVTDHRKDWWPQAEGIVGFLNAYQISGNRDFLDTAEHVWDFTNEFIIDKTKGEWHEKVNRGGEPYKLDKVRSWKCPYHNGRAALEVLQRSEALLETSAYA